MSAGLVLETSVILVVNLALGGDKQWRKLVDNCLWILEKILDLQAFKVLSNDSVSCIVSQGSALYCGKQDCFRF